MSLDEFLKELDDIYGKVLDIVINRTLPYIDDLDMLCGDIARDIENEVFDGFSSDELIEYLDDAKHILEVYEV